MLIDVARAYAQRRQVHEAVGALREAEEITPEQVRSHDLARQLVSDLLTMQDPPAGQLRDLARRLTAKASVRSVSSEAPSKIGNALSARTHLPDSTPGP